MTRKIFTLHEDMRKVKVKVQIIQQQAELAQGVPGSLMSRIFLTFGTTWVVDCQPYTPVALPQEKSLLLIFRGWVDPRAHWRHEYFYDTISL